ncbi:hypothetical protein HHI36_023419 [Cryptolaemus montrouzieri]|uniref:Uncharacterized protein n=1 Tax=Cryptolaemus montrouzieri TaxID=559131 RepID=A0ABD2PGP5_9CUCU
MILSRIRGRDNEIQYLGLMAYISYQVGSKKNDRRMIHLRLIPSLALFRIKFMTNPYNCVKRIHPSFEKLKRAPKETEPAPTTPPHILLKEPIEDVNIHVHKDEGTGGGICAKIVFFILFSALIVLIGLIITEHRGLTDLDVADSESKYSQIFEGWIDDEKHDDHHTLDDHDNEHFDDEEHERDSHTLDDHDNEHIDDEETEEASDEEHTLDDHDNEHFDDDQSAPQSEENDEDDSQDQEQTEERSEEKSRYTSEVSEEDEVATESQYQEDNSSIRKNSDEDEEEEDDQDKDIDEDDDSGDITEDETAEDSTAEKYEDTDNSQQKEIEEDTQDISKDESDPEDENASEDEIDDSKADDDDNIIHTKINNHEDIKNEESEEDHDERNEATTQKEQDEQVSDERNKDDDDDDAQKPEVSKSSERQEESEEHTITEIEEELIANKIPEENETVKSGESDNPGSLSNSPSEETQPDEEVHLDLSRRNTLIPPPPLQEIERDLDYAEEEYTDEEVDQGSTEDVRGVSEIAREKYSELRSTYSRSISPVSDIDDDQNLEEESEEEIDIENLEDEELEEEEEEIEELQEEEDVELDEYENEEYEDDEDEELMKKLEAKYGKLKLEHQPKGRTPSPELEESDSEKLSQDNTEYEFSSITNEDDWPVRKELDEAQNNLPKE